MAVLLSDATFQRIMKMLDAYEKGELHVITGDGLKVNEVGPDGTIIAIDAAVQSIDVCGLGTVQFYTKP
jgi:hypothetical protein